jgi:hypothetical protein
MFTIIKHAYVDKFRRKRSRPAEEPLWDGVGYEEPMLSLDNPLCSMPLAPEDILLQREAVEQVREAIQRLPDEMREVLELREVEGLSYREIAHRERPWERSCPPVFGEEFLASCLIEARQAERGTRRAADQADKAGTGGERRQTSGGATASAPTVRRRWSSTSWAAPRVAGWSKASWLSARRAPHGSTRSLRRSRSGRR